MMTEPRKKGNSSKRREKERTAKGKGEKRKKGIAVYFGRKKSMLPENEKKNKESYQLESTEGSFSTKKDRKKKRMRDRQTEK